MNWLKKFVPKEILRCANKAQDIQGKGIITFKDDEEITSHPCGCMFKRGRKKFSLHNHWCLEHAPSYKTEKTFS